MGKRVTTKPIPAQEYYLPDAGERVRVVEVCPLDGSPTRKVGDVITVRSASPATVGGASRDDGFWVGILLCVPDDTRPGTWCRVEPLPADEVWAGEAAELAAEFDAALE